TPSGNMPFVLSLACIKMRLTPEEAVNAATLNGAFAMELDAEYGSITPGKKAHLIITRPLPSLAYLPYAFGSDHIAKVVLQREVIEVSD
ncbi:MAG: amidohydrolase family protein, partial [Saprospiraceae bacterium]|nr:amidohydrolase family protein [Saprospiraceae bacterium]